MLPGAHPFFASGIVQLPPALPSRLEPWAEWREDKGCSGLFFAPQGQESLAQGLAQGLPWETRSNVTSPEGAPAFRDVARGRLVIGRPFRASGDKSKTQGKPWAMLSGPFGPEPLRRGKKIS
jgi:hypothetical protein